LRASASALLEGYQMDDAQLDIELAGPYAGPYIASIHRAAS